MGSAIRNIFRRPLGTLALVVSATVLPAARAAPARAQSAGVSASAVRSGVAFTDTTWPGSYLPRSDGPPLVPMDAGRPFRDFGGAVVALGRDLWQTASAPFWMDRRAWLRTGGVLAIGGLLFLADDDITRLALRNEEEPVFEQVLDVGTFVEPIGLMGNTNVWLAAGAVTSYAVGLDRPKRLFTELLYSQWIAGLTRRGVNRLVGRSRPHIGRGSRRFAVGGGTSFPSGHASTAFQVAAVLSYHANSIPVSVALYGLAGTLAWQRIADEQHWASDVWLGSVYGWAVAKLVIRLHEEDALGVTPVLGPSGQPGLGIRLQF